MIIGRVRTVGLTWVETGQTGPSITVIIFNQWTLNTRNSITICPIFVTHVWPTWSHMASVNSTNIGSGKVMFRHMFGDILLYSYSHLYQNCCGVMYRSHASTPHGCWFSHRVYSFINRRTIIWYHIMGIFVTGKLLTHFQITRREKQLIFNTEEQHYFGTTIDNLFNKEPVSSNEYTHTGMGVNYIIYLTWWDVKWFDIIYVINIIWYRKIQS